MHIKFTAGRGQDKGGARRVVEYLLGEKDGKGDTRPGVEVLRGNPYLIAAVADTLTFKHKYSSCVLSFAPEDSPSPEEIHEVLNEFELTAWAGLETDQYTYAAVLHHEKFGGCHIHILTPRCELQTGKSLNISPPGRKGPEGYKPHPIFDALRDYFNSSKGWARPDDPLRARILQPGHKQFFNKDTLRVGVEVEADPRILITDYLLQLIECGQVNNRAEIVLSLKEAGFEVPRQGQNYITALDPDSGSRWRLKGAIYGQDFDAQRLTKESPRETDSATEDHRSPDPERAKIAWEELSRRRASRAKYHRERYGSPSGADKLINQTSYDQERSATFGSTSKMGKKMGPTSNTWHKSLLRPWDWQLGPHAILQLPSSGPTRNALSYPKSHRERKTDIENNPTPNLGSDSVSGQTGEICGAALGNHIGEHLERGRQTCDKAFIRLREIYDRARTAVDQRISQAIRAIRSGAGAASRASQSLVGACAEAQQTSRLFDSILQSPSRCVERGLATLKRKRKYEFEQTKAKTNLAAVIQSFGYGIDNPLSNEVAIILMNERERFVVMTCLNGEGAYYSLQDENDRGTIMQFWQKFVPNKNGPSVRETYRKWAKISEEKEVNSSQTFQKPRPTSPAEQRQIRAAIKAQLKGKIAEEKQQNLNQLENTIRKGPTP